MASAGDAKVLCNRGLKQVKESERSITRSNLSQLGRKILVIDDEVELRRFVKLRLSRAGYKVFEASNGIEGLEQLYKAKPHLVVLDIMMPKMDGWETCRRIREVSDVPILILSAKGDRGSKVKGLDLGANDYLAKPFAGFELLKKIESLLSDSESSPSEST
jgi:two-component system OmpR family response regulator